MGPPTRSSTAWYVRDPSTSLAFITRETETFSLTDAPPTSLPPPSQTNENGFGIENLPRRTSFRRPLATHHTNSSQVELAMNPAAGSNVRELQRRRGIKPTDHHRQNLAKLKEQSAKNQARKLKEAAEKDAMMKSHIGAAERAAQRARAASSRPASAAPTRRETQLSREESTYGTDFVRQNSTMTVADAAAKGKTRISEMRAIEEERRIANDFTAKRDYGRVPDYLVERKLELLERERLRREKEELAHIPPGMRVLPEDERLRTLEILAENRADVETKLLALPIAKDGTPVVHRRKAELEARMAEIEDAQRIFGRSTVLVRA